MIDKPLTNEQIKILEAQIERYSEIKENKTYTNNKQKITEDGKIILEEGTLIHGTYFDIDVLKKISEYGVLACEIFGEFEHDETYYCADFFRVPKTQSMEEYYEFCKEKETLAGFEINKMETVKLPVLEPFNIGIIINNDSYLQELLSYDSYRGNIVTQGIVNQQELIDTGLYDKRERLAAILIGVPSNCISGIWVGEKIKIDREKIEQLKSLFSKSYIITNDGTILYRPINEEKEQDWERCDDL